MKNNEKQNYMRLKTILLAMVASVVFFCLPTTIIAKNSTLNLGTAQNRRRAIPIDNTKSKSVYDILTSSNQTPNTGMFNVFQRGNDYFFEIPLNLIGRDMLVINKLQRVPEELNAVGANRGINYGNYMVRFELDQANSRLLVRQVRPLPHTPDGDVIAQSVQDNYISPLITAFTIDAYNNDGSAAIIRVNDVYDGTETSINNVFTDLNMGSGSIRPLSRILSIKAFENNIVATSELTTRVSDGASSSNVTVEVSSSLMLLPEQPMMGRYSNARVGYFTNSLLSYSDAQQQVDKKSFITRWRLEPKPEDQQRYLSGELVEPAKPIVFYIDNSTPVQWRKYIKQGIEDWQIAFEKAGFKNAILAKDITQDMVVDMDDVNYSVVTYAASTRANAMGPSIYDPRSGEILDADIIWWHNLLKVLQEWNTIQTGAIRPEVRSTILPDDVMGDAIRFVACHEVGHSLGLRHNMMASWAYSTESLRSKDFTNKVNATSSSIMDYARYNYVAQPGDEVTAVSPNIGPYDLFAIEYGYRWYGAYTPEAEKDVLYSFLNKHNDRLYKYSEAQDIRDAVDPRAQSEDLGDNPITSSKLGIANLKRIVPQIIEWTTTGEKGQTYEEASRLYNAAIHQWNNYLYHVMANIGGIYLENTTVGDGQKTYTFVEKEKQQQSLQFLLDEALCYPTWLFDSNISEYTYLLKNTPIGKVETAPTQVLKNAQFYLMWDLLSNNRLLRMLENETKNGKNAFTAVDLIDGLHKGIFAATEKGLNTDVMIRALQKNFVDVLITATSDSDNGGMSRKMINNHFLLDNQDALCSGEGHAHCSINGDQSARRELNFYGTQINRVSDAISVKRGELLRIKDLLQNRLNTQDIATKYHYRDLILRINTALGL